MKTTIVITPKDCIDNPNIGELWDRMQSEIAAGNAVEIDKKIYTNWEKCKAAWERYMADVNAKGGGGYNRDN